MKQNETKVLIVRPKTATAKGAEKQATAAADATAKQTTADAAADATAKQTTADAATDAAAKQTTAAAATDAAAVQANAIGATTAKLFDGAPVNPVTMQEDELKKARERIAELENRLRKEPQTIEERIAYYKRKQELTARYERYNAQVVHLEELRAQVESTNELADDFSDARDFYKLQLFMPGYSKDAAVSITNQSLIDAVLNMLKGKMLDKAAELKAEISA